MQYAVKLLTTVLLMASADSHRQSFNPINFGGARYDPTNRPLHDRGVFAHRRPTGIHLTRPNYGQFGSHVTRPAYGQAGHHFVRPGQGHVGFGHAGNTGLRPGVFSSFANGQSQGHRGHIGNLRGNPLHPQGLAKPALQAESHSATGNPSRLHSGSVSQPNQVQITDHHVPEENGYSGQSEGVVSVVDGIKEVPHITTSHVQQTEGHSIGHIHGQGGIEQVPGAIPSTPEQSGLSQSSPETAVNTNCRLFKQDANGEYVCDEPQVSESLEPFQCPAVVPFCPKLGERIAPQECESDADCGGVGKCCPDACYAYSICRGGI